jgi:hypothetical protein
MMDGKLLLLIQHKLAGNYLEPFEGSLTDALPRT